MIAWPLGSYLLNFPTLLRGLTYSSYYLELIGPFLLFSPVYNGIFRALMVLVYTLFQIGLGTTLTLGLFPFISTIAIIPFLPSSFWNKIKITLQLNAFKKLKKWVTNHFIKRNLKFKPYRVTTIISGFFVIVVLMWNLQAIKLIKIPKSLKWISDVTYVRQRWGMFAPKPTFNDGWFVIPGKLADGTEVDIFGGGFDIDWEKPKRVSRTFDGHRWRRYMIALRKKKGKKHRYLYAQYMCRSWNRGASKNKQLRSLEIIFNQELTTLDAEPKKVKKVTLWKGKCKK